MGGACSAAVAPGSQRSRGMARKRFTALLQINKHDLGETFSPKVLVDVYTSVSDDVMDLGESEPKALRKSDLV